MNPVQANAPAISPLMTEIAMQDHPNGTLYVVATPIGNIGDISLRALNVLSIADAVACEDTRNTAQLLHRYGMQKSLIAAHQHNEREAAEKIIERLRDGERIALVSDAGTPGVSDPGARIVDAVRSAGLRVVPIPGACAAIAALSVSGLLQDQFLFIGFLPSKIRQRDNVLSNLRKFPGTLVFYEAPHRITEAIDALIKTFEPSRVIVFARELTKLFEEIHRCTLGDAANWLATNPHREKGEYVIVLEGLPSTTDGDSVETDRILTILLADCSVKQAAAMAAQITGQKKNALYDRALQLSSANDLNHD